MNKIILIICLVTLTRYQLLHLYFNSNNTTTFTHATNYHTCNIMYFIWLSRKGS